MTPNFTPSNQKPVPDIQICRFPKHNGRLWVDVIEDDRKYVEWILYESDMNLKDELVEYLEDLLEEM